jgi:diphthine synthase
MFHIIGIGLSTKQITLEAKEILKKVNQVYIDNYTNILSSGEIKNLEEIIDKKIISLNRKELEQDKEFIKDNNALLVIGNAFSATTHYSLIEDLNLKNIKHLFIPGISIFNYISCFGLSEYKFGKTTSIVYPEKNYFPDSFYKTIVDNLSIGAHTLCLLDIKVIENRFMTVKEACNILDKIDTENKLKDKKCVLLSKMGSTDQKIIVFNFKDYEKINYDKKPQSLIICGNLSEYENVNLDGYRML